MLKLKLQYFGYQMQRDNSLEKTLVLEKIEGKRKRRLQRMRRLHSNTNSMDMNLSKFQKIVDNRGACLTTVPFVTNSWTFLGRKVMTKLDSILKNRNITWPTKVRLVKAMVYPVVMYGCESWTVKKAECRRIDAFELWCWRRLLKVPWSAKRSNQSILKEISPGCSLEGLMLKLKLQYFGHLM